MHISALHQARATATRRFSPGARLAALATVVMFTVTGCVGYAFWEGQDYALTGGAGIYATVQSVESWQVSYDLFIGNCGPQVGHRRECVRNFLNKGSIVHGWGAAQFHEANNGISKLGNTMITMLQHAGFNAINLQDGNIPAVQSDLLAYEGYPGIAWCMQFHLDLLDNTNWNATTWMYDVNQACNFGRPFETDPKCTICGGAAPPPPVVPPKTVSTIVGPSTVPEPPTTAPVDDTSS